MLRLSNKLLNFAHALSRTISQNATKPHPACSSSSTALTSTALSQLQSNLENLRITTPPTISYNKKEIIDLPIIPRIIENPRDAMISEIRDIIRKDNQIIESPNRITPGTENGIQAARLIVIRRRKMKKHKLRKLRKKMKFEWAKVRQRREMRKEKRYQAGLLFRIKKAEAFSAEEYVSEKLRQANEIPIPRYWKGKRLPQFIIKQKLGIK